MTGGDFLSLSLALNGPTQGAFLSTLQADAVAHFDFVNEAAIVNGDYFESDDVFDFFTDTRTAAAWAVDKSGKLYSFTGSQFRRTKSGLWINNANTHNIKNSAAVGASAPSTFPTGWVYSAGTGVTMEVVQLITDPTTGYPSIDIRVVGTASGTTGPSLRFTAAVNEIAASPSENWVGSIFYKGLSGNYDEITNVFLQLQAYDSLSGGLAAGNGAATVFHDYWERHAIRFTAPASTAYMTSRLKMNIVNGVTYDFVVRLALPLLGTFNNLAGMGANGGYSANLWEGPAPAVSTGVATGTVDRDDVRLVGDALTALNAVTGTWIFKINTPVNSLESSKALFDIRSAGGERRFAEFAPGTGQINFRTSGTTYGSANQAYNSRYVAGENLAVGWSFDGATNILATHSPSVGSVVTTAGTMRQNDTARNLAYICSSGGLVSLNGFLQEMIFFDEALSSDRLGELTVASYS